LILADVVERFIEFLQEEFDGVELPYAWGTHED
jgi:hypothetical protein